MTALLQSCIYTGTVRHRRQGPPEHAFRYRVFLVYLDLAELDRAFRGRWLWSARGPNVAWFRRADYLGDARVPLDQAVRDRVAARLGRRPSGPIRVLTNLRTFGFAMNPVSFYYCFDDGGARLDAVVAEITNTPWGERYAYVLDCLAAEGSGAALRFRFAKQFHVSPFLPMELEYDWEVGVPGRALAIHMEDRAGDRCVFDATLALERRPWSARSLAGALCCHPFITAKVFLAIYWNALLLWWKRAPFYVHPRKRADRALAAP